MRFWILTLALFGLPLLGLAQHPNHWINFGQTYYKIAVAKDGIYRLTHDQLATAGIPVNAIDPRLIQVFRRGVEQAIFFKHDQSPADPTFDATEYLEFYGQKNDGTLDAKLYKPASAQPNQFTNLYSDTSAYFLTWNSVPVQGKRMQFLDQVNSTGIPKEAAHIDEHIHTFATEYADGEILEDYYQQSHFNIGEGWTGPIICTNAGCTGQQDFTLDLLNHGVPASGPPNLTLQLVGRDDLQHRAEIYAGPSIGTLRLVTSVDFVNFQSPVVNSPLNWTDIAADGKMIVRVKAVGVGGARDRMSVSYITTRHPQDFDLGGSAAKKLNLSVNAGGKSYVEMTNAPAGARIWDITAPVDPVMIGTRTAGSILSAVVPNTASARKLLVGNEILTVQPDQISKVSFREMNTDAAFLIVTHRTLMQPAGGYANPVLAFAAYRASPVGGGYDTLIVTVDQLYDQFNYGETSTLAIYEFMRFMIAEGNPQYLFLIGKGRDVSAGHHRNVIPPGDLRDLVPPAGHPTADMTFTAGMKGEDFVPAVATGRLSASTAQQVAIYLNKIKEAEAVPFDQLWRKKILHLSGGIQPNELNLFRQYMSGFADIATGPYLGGTVTTVAKHAPVPVEFINIAEEINKGVNLVTFFGHSATSTTDIDIGNVSEPVLGYNNPGKYPVFLVNGCNAGEFFGNQPNFGENWIMTPNKGARNFIANSSFGSDGSLRYYTTLFYEVAFGDTLFINKGVGDVQKEVARRFLKTVGHTSSTFTALVHQMVLLGDPSIRLFAPSKPDFELTDGAISMIAFDSKQIHALTDSIELRVVVKNLGRVTTKPLHVRITHTIGEAVADYDSFYESVRYEDTLRFSIRKTAAGFFGLNTIRVSVDPLDKIEELSESNNVGTWSKFISYNGTKNLQPPDFGIVSSVDVDFLFMDTDLHAPVKTYVLELDTMNSFDSQFRQIRTITARVLNRTHFTLPDKDSTVYYWRTKIQGQPDDQWETTSFSYIRESPDGWSQIRFDQLRENTFSGLVPDAQKVKLEFEPTAVSVFVKTFGSGSPTPVINGSFQVNNAEMYFSPQGFGCRSNTINLVAFDRSTVVPYLAVPFTFLNSGGRSCGREPQIINSFTAAETLTGNNDDLIQFVDNVKQGDSVVLFSMGDTGFSSWSTQVKHKVGELGISVADIDAFLPGEPIIILARKGAAPGAAKIVRASLPNPEQQELQLARELHGAVSSGSVRSPLIGPALSWQTVFPTIGSVGPDDVVDLEVYGVTVNGTEVLLKTATTIQFNIESIDASLYPYLRLVYRTTDGVNLTAAQLKKWIVIFEPAPDGLTILKDPQPQIEVPEGTVVQSNFGFVNISKKPFPDSLDVAFTVFNKPARTFSIQNFRIPGPLPGDTSSFVTTTNTRFKAGLNDMSVSVKNGTFVEQYTQNNSIDLPGYLHVTTDRLNPIVDVIVDGRYLLNDDFVSHSPFILITVKDENRLLLQKDTTGVIVQLQYPCAVEECPSRRINFSREDVHWSIADDRNELRIEFRPNLDPGDYVLNVQARDVSGNPAGVDPYRIRFKVTSESLVLFVQPYPNPSPGDFFFDFKIAGANIPESFLLQVFNRQGQLVAAFDEHDVAITHVGSSQLKWTGRDDRGNRLADGIYLYRIAVKSGGKQFNTTGKVMISSSAPAR